MKKILILFSVFFSLVFAVTIFAAADDASGWQVHDQATAASLLSGKNLAASEQGLKRALSVNSKYLAAHNDLGVIYGIEGRYEEAKREFERALAIDPGYLKAKKNLELLEIKFSEKIKQAAVMKTVYTLSAVIAAIVILVSIIIIFRKKPVIGDIKGTK